MKDYSRIIGKITSTPWMITDDALKMMLEIFEAHLSGDISVEQLRERYGPVMSESEHTYSSRVGNVGVLNLSGPIFPKANLMTDMSGATSLEQFRTDFREMLADDNVTSILLDIDSPGGISDHVEETAMEIREGRNVKPIYAIANTAMNSAAYYLGSQASQVFATPSAQLGSIGVYTVHRDDSVAKELSGVKETVIKAGKFKAAMVSPLNDESHGHIQGLVDATNENFIKNVALGRGVDEDDVRHNFGEGGIVTVEHAYNNKMIDGIRTYDQVIDSMAQASPVPGSDGGSVFIPAYANVTYSDVTSNGFTWTVNTSYDADKEHSEPGSGLGGEPTPREPPEKGDKAIEGGWRRDPPPIVQEEEESAVNRQWMEERAEILGIDYNATTTDEMLAEAVQERIDEIVVPLNEATVSAASQREFEKDYPEQAAKFAELLTRDRETSALSFAEGFAKFDEVNKGYSPVVRDKIAQAHAKVSLRQFSHDDLTELLAATASKDAVVPLGESGSARFDDTVLPSTNFGEARKQFADLVRTAMTEDNLTQAAAIEHVSQQHPDLAEAYLYGHATK
jgi:signal peptide peptidase SppA